MVGRSFISLLSVELLEFGWLASRPVFGLRGCLTPIYTVQVKIGSVGC